jgi:hypothetical protein
MIFRKPRYDKSMIEQTGAWNIKGRDVKDHHFYDKKLCKALIRMLINENCFVLNDLGCGDGRYVRALDKVGINAKGFDGNINTPDITKGYGVVKDLSKPISIRSCNWVLSLEVGEHIPSQFEKIFLDNLTASAHNGIVMSWAVPGQGGLGHVNCRTNYHIEMEMVKRGFTRDVYAEDFLRRHSSLHWFKHTIMVYRATK